MNPLPKPKKEPILCYVEGNWAYFTTQSLRRQWGDDWNDAPYQHNAGTPYEFGEHDRKAGKKPWEITIVGFRAGLTTPEWSGRYWSVQQINEKKIPWLFDYDGNDLEIFAGTKLSDFISTVKRIGGEVYLKA